MIWEWNNWTKSGIKLSIINKIIIKTIEYMFKLWYNIHDKILYRGTEHE